MGGHGHGGHGAGHGFGHGHPGFLGGLIVEDVGACDPEIDNCVLIGVDMAAFGVEVSSIPGLQASVVAALPSTFAKWEGNALPYMYADSKGNITTGTGNLIDPVGAALALPWKNSDGSLASQGEISDAWNTVKSAYPDVQSTASQTLTSIRLDAAALNDLVLKTVQANHNYFLTKYPKYTTWPADAQMALHSIAWAWGPGFSNPSDWGSNGAAFDAAVNASPPDFATAATIMKTASVHEESINPGIVPRDNANVIMFNNAAQVVKSKGDVTAFYYPGAPTAGSALTSNLKKFGPAGVGAGAGFLVGGPLGAVAGAALATAGTWLAGKLSSGGAGLPNVLSAIKLPGAAPAGPVDPKAVQTKLNALGMASPPLVVDGSIGPLSTAAIKAFQTSKKLPVTGIVDAATRKALGV
jgi:hypothetical protein